MSHVSHHHTVWENELYILMRERHMEGTCAVLKILKYSTLKCLIAVLSNKSLLPLLLTSCGLLYHSS